MSIFLQLYKMYKKYRLQIFEMFLIAILILSISIVMPIISQKLIDEGLYNYNIKKIIFYTILLSIIILIYSILNYMQFHIEMFIKGQMEFDLMKKAFSHALKLKASYLKKSSLVTILDNVFYDIQEIINITENSFLTIFITMFKTLGACIALFYLDWRLAIYVLLIIPIKLILNYFLKVKTTFFSSNLKRINEEYNIWFEDVVDGALDIKRWGLYQVIENEYNEFERKTIDNNIGKGLLHKKYNETIECIQTIGLNLLYIIGAKYIFRNELSIGQLLSFVTFSSYLLNPVDVFLHLRVILKEIEPSIISFKKFMEFEEENVNTGKNITNLKVETIKFENVCLSIDKTTILENINFEINDGEKVAFIGENGSGKTSCLNLIERMMEPTSGNIYINNINISDFNIIDYRRNLGVVSQDVHLFNKSIKENILLASFEDIIMTKNQKLFQFVEHLPYRWDTNIGIEGNNLSGGEKQKIALARALQRKAKILILDEGTSAYDKNAKSIFNKLMQEIIKNNICILVTHDECILNQMDKIIEFNNGRINIVKDKGSSK